MVAVKGHFDGTRVNLTEPPPANHPRDVLVVFESGDQPETRPSIWDVVGRHPRSRTVEEINREFRELRDERDR
jgi:hypothetical protein